MNEIVLSNGAIALVDDDDYAILSLWKWKQHRGGYVSRTGYLNGRYVLILMHRELVILPEGYEVDHINRNKLDNRKENLRAVPHWFNGHNTPIRSHSTAPFKGIEQRKSGRWCAQLKVQGVNHYLGAFDTAVEAAAAYEACRTKVLDALSKDFQPTVYTRPTKPEHDHPDRGPQGVTGYKGVHHGSPNRFNATITVKGQYFFLGSFRTPEEAAKAYNDAALAAWGERAWLNEVPT